ncbi:hypothetical protein BDZ89DRAFT_1071922 [Hymenopellis radicata]|nr:hypothetical protein BDZ89DRAFT_1071922 [Hymenopellis radicata]
MTPSRSCYCLAYDASALPELVASEHYPVTASLMVQETIFRPVSGTSHRWIKDGMPEIATRELLLLNWISFCLVHRRIGQSVAAGLITHAGPRNATFLLSTNEPLGHSLIDYSSVFFSSLQTVFRCQVQRMASGKEAFEDVDIQTMMDVVVAHVPARIHRKLERLAACGSWGGGGDVKSNLDRIFSLWETHRTSSSPDTINCTRQSVMDDYDSIVYCTCLPQLTGQARCDAFRVAQSSAKRLIRSPFIKESCEIALHGEMESVDRIFILKFHRRLWRFRFYSFGAERVLQGHIAKNMRKLCQDGWTIGNTWLPSRGEVKVILSADRYSYVASLLARRGYLATREILAKWPGFYNDDDVWRADTAKICRVHPEMELMHYLSQDDAYTRDEAVGTSKRPCLLCYWCIEHGFKPEKKPFKLTEASLKVVTDWMSPILVGTGGPVDLGIKDYLSHLEQNISVHQVERSSNCDFEPRK